MKQKRQFSKPTRLIAVLSVGIVFTACLWQWQRLEDRYGEQLHFLPPWEWGYSSRPIEILACYRGRSCNIVIVGHADKHGIYEVHVMKH